MDEALIVLAAAPEGVAPRSRPVGFVPGRPDMVESDVPEGLPVFERRPEPDIEIPDR
jgi:hypothetical protein